jgi:iron complex transport system substrate-binding protein
VDARLVAAPSRRLGGIAVAVALVAFAAGCTSAPAATPTLAPVTPLPSTAVTPPPATPVATATPAPPFPVTLADDEGTQVTLEVEPQRIVSLMPAVTETLFALGIGDRIVGKAEDVLLYPPQASAVPDVERFQNGAVAVDTEKIIAARADLVIAGGDNGTPVDAVQKLRSLGIPVLVVYPPTVEAVLTDIELIGRATGTTTAATAMTATMRAAFAATADAVKGAPAPRVYYEISEYQGTYYAPADQSFLAQMITMAGGTPITTGSTTAYTIPAETLIKADPGLILLADAAYGTTVDQVQKRPGWSVISAVKAKAISAIDDTTISRPGPRLVGGLALLAAAIHPDVTIPSPSPIPAVP